MLDPATRAANPIRARRADAARRYYWKNREKCLEYDRAYRTIPGNKEVQSARDRRYNQTTRLEKLARGRAILDGELARGCVDCGIKDFDVLDFDHLPGHARRRDVAGMLAFSPKAIYAEIDKCEVRCANCHRKITAVRRRATRGDN